MVEWYIGGDSDFCEGCLFEATTFNTSYSSMIETECPQCLLLDGFTRNTAVVNRMVPGPAVEVKYESNKTRCSTT